MLRKRKSAEPRFAIVKKGYDPTEVDAFLNAERENAERAGLEQKERISALKEQCAELSDKLREYRDREEQIKTTLVAATENAEKMTLDIKFRYAMELERLKLFRAKWTGAYEELKERYHFSKDALNMESVAVSTKLEIEKFLAQDFSLDKGGCDDEMEAEFKSEAERLSGDESKIEELKDKLVRASQQKAREEKKRELKSAETAVAFSIEEAQNPKESLADICRYLGLGKQNL